MEVKLEDCIKKLGKSLYKMNTQRLLQVPAIFFENGLDWASGDMLEMYYDKKQDIIIIKKTTFNGLLNSRAKAQADVPA